MVPRFLTAAWLVVVAVPVFTGGGCAEGSIAEGSNSGSGGSGGSSSGSGLPCSDACDGVCVNLQTDVDHCGACDNACAAGHTCLDGACVQEVCDPGETEACYSGPEGTEDIGACTSGTWTCNQEGTGYGPCEGEVTPSAELCDSAEDDDCDGTVNNGCVYARCLDVPKGSPSGIYRLDPDGTGTGQPFDAYCDMVTENGGWTLVASVVNGIYFDGNEMDFKAADIYGTVQDRLGKDYKSKAYSTVPFTEFMFMDSNNHYATYAIPGAQASVSSFYPLGLQNYVGPGVEAHSSYSYPVKATNMTASQNNCNTLRMSLNVEDSDSPIGNQYHESKKGPCWSKNENDGCYWDEAGIAWKDGTFYKGNVSTYRLWFVR